MRLLLSGVTLGILPAVWLSGYVVLVWLSRSRHLPITPLTAWCLAPAVSLPAWSLAMTVSAYAGFFHAPTWGAFGWITCLALAPFARPMRRIGHHQGWAKSLLLVTLLVLSFGLYAAFPHDSFFVGRDQATYANQALHIARAGALDLEWPVQIPDADLRNLMGRMSYSATGLYLRTDRLIVQFSPVLPVWLALAFSMAGIVGLQAFNAVIATLAIPVFFGFASRMMSRTAALGASFLFALNPMQIWISRITLSEILAQYLVLSGLLLASLGLRRETRRYWILAGLTLGASVFVRIDSFVLAPLAVSFAWVMRAVSRGDATERDHAASAGVLALLSMLALGIPFYFFTSRPYLGAQGKNLLPIAACTAVLLVFWLRGWGIRLIRSALAHRAFWVGLAALIVLLGVYAYFIRPRWEPFVYYRNPNSDLYGTRDFREDSFVNLGVYLTPVVAFGALVGFFASLRLATRGPSRAAQLLFLFSFAGFALLYFRNPNISPDQPWGMRRFVPVVIPGAVLLAFGLLDHSRATRRWRRLHLPATVFVAAGTVAHATFGMRSALFLKEYEGAYSFVSSVADSIPAGALLLCDTSVRVFGHLALGRGLPALRFSTRDPERFDASQAVLSAAVKPDETYYVLTDSPRKLSGAEPIRVFKARFGWLQETPKPPANSIRQATFDFFLFERRGPLEEPWRYLADLGFSPIDGVREGGFWPVEGGGTERTRWTQAEAWLDIPIKSGWSPRRLDLEIVGLPAAGTWLTIRANGSEIHNAMLARAPVHLSLSLPKKIGRRLRIELESDTFKPSDTSASEDHRDLGVRIKGIGLR